MQQFQFDLNNQQFIKSCEDAGIKFLDLVFIQELQKLNIDLTQDEIYEQLITSVILTQTELANQDFFNNFHKKENIKCDTYYTKLVEHLKSINKYDKISLNPTIFFEIIMFLKDCNIKYPVIQKYNKGIVFSVFLLAKLANISKENQIQYILSLENYSKQINAIKFAIKEFSSFQNYKIEEYQQTLTEQEKQLMKKDFYRWVCCIVQFNNNNNDSYIQNTQISIEIASKLNNMLLNNPNITEKDINLDEISLFVRIYPCLKNLNTTDELYKKFITAQSLDVILYLLDKQYDQNTIQEIFNKIADNQFDIEDDLDNPITSYIFKNKYGKTITEKLNEIKLNLKFDEDLIKHIISQGHYTLLSGLHKSDTLINNNTKKRLVIDIEKMQQELEMERAITREILRRRQERKERLEAINRTLQEINKKNP